MFPRLWGVQLCRGIALTFVLAIFHTGWSVGAPEFTLTHVASSGVIPKSAIVSVSVLIESDGVLVNGRYLRGTKVQEHSQLTGVVLDDGVIVCFMGFAMLSTDLAKAKFMVRTFSGAQVEARPIGVDERIFLLFLRADLPPNVKAVQTNLEDSVKHLNLAKWEEGKLRVAAPCSQGSRQKEWLPFREVKVSGLDGTEWSQSAVLDLEGRLLGITAQVYGHRISGTLSICELIPAGTIEASYRRIKNGEERIPAGWLGVYLVGDDQDRVVISSIVADSPAARAGLRLGDLPTHLDGKTFTDIAEFIWAIRWKGPGTIARLTVDREEAQRQIPVTLGLPRRRPATGWTIEIGREWNQTSEDRVSMYKTVLPRLLNLGLILETAPAAFARGLHSPVEGGLLVKEVLPGTPAADSGFEVLDLIFEINERKVLSIEDVQQVIENAEGYLQIGFVRGGQLKKLKIRLQ